MHRIPDAEEREWLGRSLRALIGKRGIDSFVASPILEPTPACFPDPWAGRLADVHRLTQRLMHAAGLAHLPFSLTGVDAEVQSEELWDRGTAGWFAGIVDGRCRFGVHPEQLDDAERAVGVMAHEVAHAYREHHRLTVDDRDLEELLTDVTTIYLGFGIFTTNNTDRYRSSGNWSETSWSFQSAGYLAPQSMAWLLGLQLAARNDAALTKRVLRHLEPNQASYVSAALEEIATSECLRDLRLPWREQWPAPWDIEPITVADPDDQDLDVLPEIDSESPDRNRGTTALRVENASKAWAATLGGAYGLLPGIIFADQAFGTGESVLAAGMLGGVVIGALLGVTFLRRYKCSECGTKARSRDVGCTGCGATLGRKATERDRRQHQAEQLDLAVTEEDWVDCPDCRPESPCALHPLTEIGFGEAEEPTSARPQPPRDRPTHSRRRTRLSTPRRR